MMGAIQKEGRGNWLGIAADATERASNRGASQGSGGRSDDRGADAEHGGTGSWIALGHRTNGQDRRKPWRQVWIKPAWRIGLWY